MIECGIFTWARLLGLKCRPGPLPELLIGRSESDKFGRKRSKGVLKKDQKIVPKVGGNAVLCISKFHDLSLKSTAKGGNLYL